MQKIVLPFSSTACAFVEILIPPKINPGNFTSDEAVTSSPDFIGHFPSIKWSHIYLWDPIGRLIHLKPIFTCPLARTALASLMARNVEFIWITWNLLTVQYSSLQFGISTLIGTGLLSSPLYDFKKEKEKKNKLDQTMIIWIRSTHKAWMAPMRQDLHSKSKMSQLLSWCDKIFENYFHWLCTETRMNSMRERCLFIWR